MTPRFMFPCSGPKPRSLDLTSAATTFGLYWGSIDAYNTLAFYSGGMEVYSLTGTQLAGLTGLTADGSQTSATSNAYISFAGLPSFDKVTFASSQNSFEFDNVMAGVPEASTWMMLGLGFGGLAFAGFGAKRKRETRALV